MDLGPYGPLDPNDPVASLILAMQQGDQAASVSDLQPRMADRASALPPISNFVTEHATASRPAGESYADALATAFDANPLPRIDPYASPGVRGWGGFLSGLTRGFAANQGESKDKRAAFQKNAEDIAMRRNLANLAASDEHRKYMQQVGLEGLKEKSASDLAETKAGLGTAYTPTAADVARNPAVAPFLNKPMKLEDAAKFGIISPAEKPLSTEFQASHHLDSATGQWIPNGGAGGPLTPDDLRVYTAANGAKYVDLGDFQPKQELEASRLARKLGYTPLKKDDAASVKTISTFFDNLDAAAEDGRTILPKNAGGRFLQGLKNEAGAITHLNTTAANYQNFRLLAIPFLKSLGGKGSGFRMTQPEINQAIKNLPGSLWQDQPAMEKNVTNVKRIIGASMERSLPSGAVKPSPVPGLPPAPTRQGFTPPAAVGATRIS